jgi:hypothetical protein
MEISQGTQGMPCDMDGNHPPIMFDQFDLDAILWCA